MAIAISQMDDVGTLDGSELLEVSRLSSTVQITASTISALASDNSFNDSGSGFIGAGFAQGDRVNVSGFTGDVANNLFSAKIQSLTAGKMIIESPSGDLIVNDSAGESVTITKWETKRTTTQDVANLGGVGGGGGGLDGLTFTSDTGSTADSDPGNGLFKWNNATQASATVLFFDNQTLDGVSLTTFYAGLPATGYLRLEQEDDGSQWQLWKWTAVTSASGYYKFTVTLQASAGSIADDKTTLVDFKPDANSGVGGSSKYRKVFRPRDNEPPTSNFATLDTRNGHPVLDFDTTTQETAIFSDVISAAYGGGNITVTVLAALTSATSGTLGWDVTFERVGTAQDIDSDGFATAQTITATTVPGTSGFLIALSVTITAGSSGTDSLAAGEAYRLRVRRDVANDTATGDAELWGVVVSED